jgi:hypothetical protein
MTDTPTRRERGIADANVDAPAAKPGSPAHDEWVMDEALEETFPASDPPYPMRPGSTIARRNASRSRRVAYGADAGTIALGAVFLVALVFFLMLRRRAID